MMFCHWAIHHVSNGSNRSDCATATMWLMHCHQGIRGENFECCSAVVSWQQSTLTDCLVWRAGFENLISLQDSNPTTKNLPVYIASNEVTQSQRVARFIPAYFFLLSHKTSLLQDGSLGHQTNIWRQSWTYQLHGISSFPSPRHVLLLLREVRRR